MQTEKCVEEIKNEIELIDELVDEHEELLHRLKISPPNRIEISAAATVLHSFYNGVENIFKRIAVRLDNNLPSSEYWHQELLQQMKEGRKIRDAVISDELAEKLNLYLGFRHFFRHSYTFQFRWDKLEELFLELEEVYQQFKEEINKFIQGLGFPAL